MFTLVRASWAVICYLVGTNHAHQFESQSDGDSVAFAAYLSDLCSQHRIDHIAEELNDEAIAMWEAKGSVAKSVATNFSISHRFCDPEYEDRRRLGILTDRETAKKLGFSPFWTRAQEHQVTAEVRKTWPTRERFWLDQLRLDTFERCAFVLGSEHVETFGQLLTREGFTVHVTHVDWKP